MASIKKQANGSWRVWVDKRGVRATQSFQTKAEAANWAAAKEAEIVASGAQRGDKPKEEHTLLQAIDRYIEDVVPGKASKVGEENRLLAFVKANAALCAMPIQQVDTPDLVAWRKQRLAQVTPSSVRREVNTLRHLFRLAVEEWRWLERSPFVGFQVPSDNPPRTRRIAPMEVRRVVRRLGYRTNAIGGSQAQTARAFLISLRSAMRAGEILSLGRNKLDLVRSVATVPHKTQHLTGREREVPLTRQAVRLLRPVAGLDKCFTVSPATMSALFHQACVDLMIKNLRFHDARAEALTRLSKRVDVMTLARISGHASVDILFRHYYRESAADIAAGL